MHLFPTLLGRSYEWCFKTGRILNCVRKKEYPDVNALCLFFLSSLNSSNFKSIRLRSLTAFLVPLELILLMSILCPSRADINTTKRGNHHFADYFPSPFFIPATSSRTFSSASCATTGTFNETGWIGIVEPS